MNILPIPGLDGGHALFTLAEMITGRKPSDKFLEYAQMVGMVLLMGLMAYALGLDVCCDCLNNRSEVPVYYPIQFQFFINKEAFMLVQTPFLIYNQNRVHLLQPVHRNDSCEVLAGNSSASFANSRSCVAIKPTAL